jgi:hypothetical protein
MSSVSYTRPFLVRLSSDLAAQLAAKARAEDRSKSSFVRRAIQAALVETPHMPPMVPTRCGAKFDGADGTR